MPRLTKIVILLCVCQLTLFFASTNTAALVHRNAQLQPRAVVGLAIPRQIIQPVVRQPYGAVVRPAAIPRQITQPVVRQPNALVNTNDRFLLTPNRGTNDIPPNTFSTPNNPQSVVRPCEISKSETSVPGFVCKGQLMFEDNFSKNIDEDYIWTQEIMMPGQPHYPFNLYEKKARVEDGKLVIYPITLESEYGVDFVRRSLDLGDRCTGTMKNSECYREAFGPQILPPAITAKITTKRTFGFKYGRIEVGAKMPVGDWLIPLIQLEPRDNTYGSLNYASGLIRIACVKGNIEYSKNISGGAIVSESDAFRNAYIREKIGNVQWSKKFHNYTVVWSPSEISLFVDGKKYGEVRPGQGFFEDAKKYNATPVRTWLKGSHMAPFDEMFYVSLGLDVGGIHEFPDHRDKPWSNNSNKAMLEFWNARDKWYPTWRKEISALSIDYVRIYAL